MYTHTCTPTYAYTLTHILQTRVYSDQCSRDVGNGSYTVRRSFGTSINIKDIYIKTI